MEKIVTSDKAKEWRDHIPLQWKYTAGVAGDRFLQLLKSGKIQGSVCKSCNKVFVPPKIFCKDCFVRVSESTEVSPDSGYVYSYTIVNRIGKKETILLVKFDGVEGGLLGLLKETSEEPKIGMKVRAVFKPKDSRLGELTDIAYFEKIGP